MTVQYNPIQRHHDECPRCHSYKRVWGVNPSSTSVVEDGSQYVLHRAEIISTTNEWRYYCRECDIRFNSSGMILLRTSGVGWENSFRLSEAVLKTEVVDDAQA